MPDGCIYENWWKISQAVVSMRNVEEYATWLYLWESWKIRQMVSSLRNVEKYARWCYLKNVEKYARWWYRSVMLKNMPDGCISEKCWKIQQMVVSMKNVEKYARWWHLWEMLKNMPDGCIYKKWQKTIRKV